ncbi:helicase-related protein [Streptomyces sp. NPDC127110]|uniref:helicase-related protein n=1 Tax=Streptomyces sp. NPDC127110 TaxID=3345362 RepID=UPI003642D525
MARVLRALGGRNVLVENLTSREQSTVHASRLTMVARPDGTAPTRSKRKVRDEDERRQGDGRRGTGRDTEDRGDQGDTPDDPHDKDDQGHDIGEDVEGEDHGDGPEPDDDDPVILRGSPFRNGEAATENPTRSTFDALKISTGRRARHRHGQGDALRAPGPKSKDDPQRHRFTDSEHAQAATEELVTDYMELLDRAWDDEWEDREAQDAHAELSRDLSSAIGVGDDPEDQIDQSEIDNLPHLANQADLLSERAEDAGKDDIAEAAATLADALDLAHDRFTAHGSRPIPRPRANRNRSSAWQPQPVKPAKKTAAPRQRRDRNRRFKTLSDVRAHWSGGTLRPFTDDQQAQASHNQTMAELIDKLDKPQLSRNGHFVVGQMKIKKDGKDVTGWAVIHTDTGVRLTMTARKAEATDFANRMEDAQLDGKPLNWDDPDSFDRLNSPEGRAMAAQLAHDARQAFSERAAKKRDGANARTKPMPPSSPEQQAAQQVARRTGAPEANVGVGHVGPTSASGGASGRPRTDAELRELWKRGGSEETPAAQRGNLRKIGNDPEVVLHLAANHGFAIVEDSRRSDDFRFTLRTAGTGGRLSGLGPHRLGRYYHFADRETANRFSLYLGSHLRDRDGRTLDWGSPNIADELVAFRDKDGRPAHEAIWLLAGQFDRERGVHDSQAARFGLPSPDSPDESPNAPEAPDADESGNTDGAEENSDELRPAPDPGAPNEAAATDAPRPRSRDRELAAAELDRAVDQMILAQRGTLQDDKTSLGQVERARALVAAVRDGETDSAADLGEILAEVEQAIRSREDGLDESSKRYWLNELSEARQALMRAESRLDDQDVNGNRRTQPADTGADGSEQVRPAGAEVLDDVPTGGADLPGRRTGADGVLRGAGEQDSGADRGSRRGTAPEDAAGDDAGRPGGPDAGQGSGDGAGPGRRDVPAEGTGDGAPGAGRDAGSVVEAARFRPGSQDDLAPSGERAKSKANVAAVRTLRQVQAEKRAATPEEQQELARWSGWGSLPVVLADKPNPGDNRFRDTDGEPDPEAYTRALRRWESFADERAEIRALLDDREWAAARKNTLNAHYTDSSLVQPVWDAMRALGFRRGRVLEPGSGSGNFIGHAPDGADMVGVELDPTSAMISQLLYPDAQVINKPFQELRLPPDSFDLAIGNVPFGKYKLHDPLDNPGRHHSIHDHFILKSLARVRPGGYVALVTSRFTMDGEDDSARRAMYDMADLVGAVRLPEGAHQRAAGTHVVTDLLLFRRREPSENRHNRGNDTWLTSSKVPIGGHEIAVNQYFQDNPKNVLGQMTVGRGQFSDHDLTVKGDSNTLVSMRAALGRIVAEAKADGLGYDASQQNSVLALNLADDARDGSIARGKDGAFMTVEDGNWVELDVHPKQREQLGRLLELKDFANRLVELEAGTREAGETNEMREARAALNQAYETYVRKHPSPNKPGQRRQFSSPEALARRTAEGLKDVPDEWKLPTALSLFEEDPDGHMVFGLDRWDADAKAPRKLNILTERVLQPREIPDRADTAEEAVPIALEHDGGRLELTTVARLLGIDQDAAREALGDLAFDDPVTGRLESRAAYLSGNVRQKLAEAHAAAAEDPKFAVNVAALERVVPRDIRAKDIRVKIGAPWVPIDIYEGFLRHLGLSDATVTHFGGNRWSVEGSDAGEIARKVWGVKSRDAYELFDSLLHQKLITVRETQKLPDGSKKTYVNQKATSAARTKAKDMAREFHKWVMSDPERAARLGRIYNDKFNSIALRDYDESPLTLPGIKTGWRMRPHQNAAIRRIVQEPTTLLGHVVGAGKTATMVAGAMELRRTGLAQKPSIVVPNHMLEQFSREAVALYPGAKVLAISRKDLHHKKRRKFVAKIAGGDWDIVVLTHDAFNSLPMTPQTQQAYMDKELALLRSQITKIKARDGDDPSLKQMEKTLADQEEQLKERLATLKDQRGIFFENTGIDYLFVDEAHEYKNLRTVSNLPGAAISGSGQATQLHMALGYLREHNESGRVASLATGTPIANSVTEAYVLMRYLAPHILEEAGIDDFDSWAATFGEVVTSLELAPDGSGDYREKARFAKFFNVPELLVGYRTFADIQTAADLGLPTPTVRAGENGRRGEVIAIPASAEQRRYVESLADEDWIGEPGGVLKAIGFASRAAIDMRLQGGSGHEGGKLEAAAEQISQLYEEHKDTVYPVSRNDLTPQQLPGSLQLVFLDEGTPGSTGKVKFDAYEDLRDQLAERGVPREKVRFIHEAKDDKAKAKLFEEARNGKIAVLIGSTQKMGTGTNVQDRAVALHHLSFPWRPADMEQRDGRIVRQGNLNGPNIPAAAGSTPDDVRIMYYITEGTFDEFRLGTLERKAVFINQMARRDFSAREMEDIGDAAVSLGTFKAIASGNPAIAERALAQAELVELQRQNSDWYEQQQERRDRITYLTRRIRALETALPEMRQALAQRRDVSGDSFRATLEGVEYDNRVEAAEALGQRMESIAKDTRYREGATVPLGEIGGIGFLAGVEYDRDGNRMVRLRLDHTPAYTDSAVPETRGLWSARKVGSASGRGAVQSLENLLKALDSDITKREQELDGARTARREAEEHLEAGASPFEEEVESTERRVQALTELVMHHQEARKLTDRIKEAGAGPDSSKLKERLKEVQQETRALEAMADQERAKTFRRPEPKPRTSPDTAQRARPDAAPAAPNDAEPRTDQATLNPAQVRAELDALTPDRAKNQAERPNIQLEMDTALHAVDAAETRLHKASIETWGTGDRVPAGIKLIRSAILDAVRAMTDGEYDTVEQRVTDARESAALLLDPMDEDEQAVQGPLRDLLDAIDSYLPFHREKRSQLPEPGRDVTADDGEDVRSDAESPAADVPEADVAPDSPPLPPADAGPSDQARVSRGVAAGRYADLERAAAVQAADGSPYDLGPVREPWSRAEAAFAAGDTATAVRELNAAAGEAWNRRGPFLGSPRPSAEVSEALVAFSEAAQNAARRHQPLQEGERLTLIRDLKKGDVIWQHGRYIVLIADTADRVQRHEVWVHGENLDGSPGSFGFRPGGFLVARSDRDSPPVRQFAEAEAKRAAEEEEQRQKAKAERATREAQERRARVEASASGELVAPDGLTVGEQVTVREGRDNRGQTATVSGRLLAEPQKVTVTRGGDSQPGWRLYVGEEGDEPNLRNMVTVLRDERVERGPSADADGDAEGGRSDEAPEDGPRYGGEMTTVSEITDGDWVSVVVPAERPVDVPPALGERARLVGRVEVEYRRPEGVSLAVVSRNPLDPGSEVREKAFLPGNHPVERLPEGNPGRTDVSDLEGRFRLNADRQANAKVVAPEGWVAVPDGSKIMPRVGDRFRIPHHMVGTGYVEVQVERSDDWEGDGYWSALGSYRRFHPRDIVAVPEGADVQYREVSDGDGSSEESSDPTDRAPWVPDITDQPEAEITAPEDLRPGDRVRADTQNTAGSRVTVEGFLLASPQQVTATRDRKRVKAWRLHISKNGDDKPGRSNRVVVLREDQVARLPAAGADGNNQSRDLVPEPADSGSREASVESVAERDSRESRGEDNSRENQGEAPDQDQGEQEPATESEEGRRERRRRRDRGDRGRLESGGPGGPGAGLPRVPQVPNGRDRGDDENGARDRDAGMTEPGRLKDLMERYRSGGAPVPQGADPERHAKYLRGLASNDSLTLSPDGNLITWTNTDDNGTWRFGHAASGLHLDGWEAPGDQIGGRDGARLLAGEYERLRDEDGEGIDWAQPQLDGEALRQWRDSRGEPLTDAVDFVRDSFIRARAQQDELDRTGNEESAGILDSRGADVDTDSGASPLPVVGVADGAAAAAGTAMPDADAGMGRERGDGGRGSGAGTPAAEERPEGGAGQAPAPERKREPNDGAPAGDPELDLRPFWGPKDGTYGNTISEEGAIRRFGSLERMRALAGRATMPGHKFSTEPGEEVWLDGRLLGYVADLDIYNRTLYPESYRPKWEVKPQFFPTFHEPLYRSREAAIAEMVLRGLKNGPPDTSRVTEAMAFNFGNWHDSYFPKSLPEGDFTSEEVDRYEALDKLLRTLGAGRTATGDVADDIATAIDELQWLEGRYNGSPDDTVHISPKRLQSFLAKALDHLRPEDPRAAHHRESRYRAAMQALEDLKTDDALDQSEEVPVGELRSGDVVMRLSGVRPSTGSMVAMTGYLRGAPRKVTRKRNGVKTQVYSVRVGQTPWEEGGHEETIILPADAMAIRRAHLSDVEIREEQLRYGVAVGERAPEHRYDPDTDGIDYEGRARAQAQQAGSAVEADSTGDAASAPGGADETPRAPDAPDTAASADADRTASNAADPAVGQEPARPAGTAPSPGRPAAEEDAAGDDAAPKAEASPEPVGGRPAEWVKVADLGLSDLVRIEGITKTGTPRTLAGYVVDGPKEIETTQARRVRGMYRVLIADTPEGRGKRSSVWVTQDATAARATSDSGDRVDGAPPTGADAAVLTGDLSERVSTDPAGNGLFPGSVVTDDNGREGVVTGANASGARVQFGDDRTDDAHAPTSLRVTDGGAARPGGWTIDGHLVRRDSIVAFRDGTLLGTVEDVNGDTATLATPRGMEEWAVSDLRVVSSSQEPNRDRQAKVGRLERVSVRDIAQGDSILVDGTDGMATAEVTGKEEVSDSHTRLTTVDTTTGELRHLDGGADAVYTRLLDGNGRPVRLGPEDAPDGQGELAAHEPAPAVAPVSGPTVEPQLSPEERAAIDSRGQAPTGSPDAQQAAARIANGLPVTPSQAAALADDLREGADPSTAEGRAVQRAADHLDAAAGNEADAPAPPQPGTVGSVGVGDTITLPDEFDADTMTAYRVVDVHDVPGGVRVLTIEDGDGLRFKRALPAGDPLYQLPEPQAPEGDADAERRDPNPAPDAARLRSEYADAVVRAVVDSAVQGTSTPSNIHQLREQIAKQVTPEALRAAMRRAREAAISAIADAGFEASERDEAVRSLRPEAARARREAIRAALRTVNDLEALDGESEADTSRRAADLLRLIPDALRNRPQGNDRDSEDSGGVDDAVAQHTEAAVDEALQAATSGGPLTEERRAAIVAQLAARLAAGRQTTAERIAANVPAGRRPGVFAHAIAALVLLARKIIALVAAFLKALARLIRRGLAGLRDMRARVARFRRGLRRRIRSWPETRRLRRLAAATDLPQRADSLPLGDQVAHWARLLPAPGRFGQISRRARWYRPASRTSLAAGQLPPLQDGVRWTMDRAVDGGPGPQALRHLAAVRAAGSDVDTDLSARLSAAAPELGDEPHTAVRQASEHADAAEHRLRDLEAAQAAGTDPDPEIAAARAEAQAARQEAARLQQAYAAALPSAVRDSIAEVREVGPGTSATLVATPDSDPDAVRAIRDISEFLPRDWLTPADARFIGARTGGAGAYDPNSRIATIADLGDGGRRTAAYALLAHLQQHYPDLLAAQEAFHFTRTHTGRTGARRRTALDMLLARLFHGRTERAGTGDLVPLGLATLFSGDWYEDDDLRAFLLGLLATR